MIEFSYQKKALGLRTQVTSMIVFVLADSIQVPILLLVLKKPWNWLLAIASVIFYIWAYPFISKILRTRHQLDENGLRLRYGRFQLNVPRSAIVEVTNYNSAMPHGTYHPLHATYSYEQDTLFMVSERKRLVQLTLAAPMEAKVRRAGLVQFTRIVLTVDEPERFLSAFQSASTADPDVTPQVTPDAEEATSKSSTAVVATDPEAAGSGAEDAIRLSGLEKRYGDFPAVKGINLSVRPGEILAFLGSNGAGKTTTIKMMVGLLRPTSGKVFIKGRSLTDEGPDVRRLIGYVPDIPLLYDSLTAEEFLWMIAGLYGMARADGRSRTRELLGFLKMERWANHQIRDFSLGMKRKMAIAAALVHQPSVLLLDEVTNGLDPRAARDIKDFISEMARRGTAVFLTTHILDVAEELAHRIAIVHGGEIRALGTLSQLQIQAGMPDANLEALFLAFTSDDAKRGTNG